MIQLNNSYLISKGSERSCYVHPSDSDICIKVTRKFGPRTHARNKREVKYAEKYNQSSPSLTVVPYYYGTIETNLGIGVLFQLVRDYDKSISIRLADHIAKNTIDSTLQYKIVDLYHTLLKASILVSDLHPGNLLLQKSSENDYKLVMIDGFGNSDFIKICDYSHFFLKKKLIRKFERMLLQIGLPTEGIC